MIEMSKEKFLKLLKTGKMDVNKDEIKYARYWPFNKSQHPLFEGVPRISIKI